MPSILDYLNTISDARYGRDVRQAIVDAISACYQDGRAGVSDLEARRLIESAIGVNESQQADIDTLYAQIAEIQEGGGDSSQESTTITLDTVIYDGGFVDSVTVNNNATKTYDVTFTQTFTEVPEVFACVAVQNSAAASYSKVTVGIVKAQTTKTGFRFFIANTSGATRSTTVVWAAFQPTTKEIDLDITIPSGEGMSEADVLAITNPIQSSLNGIKTGYDGTVYSTPGEAVREQINDLHVLIGDEPGTAISGSSVGYDGTDSGLSATDMQSAVDEVADALSNTNERLTSFDDIRDAVMSEVEKSGSIVEIEDGTTGKILSECVVTVEATRSGSGTPSPTNPRPFNGGYTGINVYVSPTQDIEDATTVSVTFPSEAGTVYSGTIDVVNGKLTVDSVYKKLVGSGNEGVSRYSGSRFRVTAPGFTSPAGTVLTTVKSNILMTAQKSAMGSNAYRISQSDAGRNELLFIAELSFSSVDEVNAWLAENNVEIVYPLDTPVEYDLTPQQIEMVEDGINFVWSNAGDTALAYTVGIDKKVDAIKSNLNSIDADQCAFIAKQSFKNLYNPNDSDIISGSKILSNNAISSETGFSVSGYIPCEAGKSYMFPFYTKKLGTGSSVRSISFFNENKEFLGNITGTLVSVVGADTTSFLTVTVPDASVAKYFRVNVLEKDANNAEIVSQFHSASNFMVVEGTTFPDRFYPYNGQSVMSEDIYSGHEELNNPLYGKRVIFLGDSICEGGSESGWAGRIGKKNTMLWENDGIGGSTISTALASKTICTRAVKMLNPDYIILEGGTNDADRIGNATGETKPAAFGTWDADEYGTNDAATYYGFDIDTFCGAVDYMCKRFVSLYPGTKIGFVGAHKMGQVLATRKNRGYYIQTAMDICKKWGIPVLDLWNGCYLNPMIPSHYTSGETYLYSDGQHLTDNGYDYITPMVEAFMKSL